jgi:hypothetical protein
VLGVLGVCAGGFTGALALSEDAPAGLLVVAAGAFALFGSVAGAVVLAGVEALWSGVVLAVCAGGFTGALALSEDAPAGLLVVAAGAFALFGSVDDAVVLAEVEALWSEEVLAGGFTGALALSEDAPAGLLVVAAAAFASAGAAALAD